MKTEEEIRNMYNNLLEVQRGMTKYYKDNNLGRLEVDEPDTYKGFRQALWWVLQDED